MPMTNGTWNHPPLHCKLIGCKWVYKTKYNVDGSVNQYKVRLVAKGYVETHDINYDETLAPVAKMKTICVVLAIATARGWYLL